MTKYQVQLMNKYSKFFTFLHQP